MRRKWIVRLTVLAAVIILAVIGLDQRMIVRTYTVESEKISVPVRLAVVADFHGCDYGDNLIQTIEKLQPDIVLLPGDIFDGVMPWDHSKKLMIDLAKRFPCYYVTGNHEYRTLRTDEICSMIKATGAIVLGQSCVEHQVKGQNLNICGIPDPYVGIDTETVLNRTVADIYEEGFTILLAHRPELIEQYVEKEAFDLIVTGHAHGGQVRIPFLVNGLYAPNQGWFPKYAGGRYEMENTTMIVSRGLARESTKVPRVFNRPELVLIELRPMDEEMR